jgi:cytochrome P450
VGQRAGLGARAAIGPRLALARLELRILIEETLKRFPEMEIEGRPLYTESPFINQLKTLPVRLTPAR